MNSILEEFISVFSFSKRLKIVKFLLTFITGWILMFQDEKKNIFVSFFKTEMKDKGREIRGVNGLGSTSVFREFENTFDCVCL